VARTVAGVGEVVGVVANAAHNEAQVHIAAGPVAQAKVDILNAQRHRVTGEFVDVRRRLASGDKSRGRVIGNATSVIATDIYMRLTF